MSLDYVMDAASRGNDSLRDEHGRDRWHAGAGYQTESAAGLIRHFYATVVEMLTPFPDVIYGKNATKTGLPAQAIFKLSPS